MDSMVWARERIAAQRGRLHGWRPILHGDVAVVALEVLGAVRGDPELLGLRVMVAGRTPEAIDARGSAEAERMLRARAVLAPEDPFLLVRSTEQHPGDGTQAGPVHCPWTALIVHVPMRRLPAIAGLATDVVPEPA
jgi:hypothetical protein